MTCPVQQVTNLLDRHSNNVETLGSGHHPVDQSVVKVIMLEKSRLLLRFVGVGVD